MFKESKSNQSSYSRRRFLQSAAVATACTATMHGFPAIISSRSPNDKLNLVIIGAGGRGRGNMKGVSSENIIALCDVNDAALEAAREAAPNAKCYKDFRVLYDEVKDMDGVVVSTAEHTHSFATLPALKMGKHVYCEKPLPHNVRETRLIIEAARKAGVATQMGTQIHAGDNYRRVVELVQGGVIGPVREVHVWVARAWGRQSKAEAEANKDIVFVQERPAEEMPVPQGVDWDLFLGPALYRPFNEVYWPGPKWYRWWDFGSGTMSDLGSHWIDLPFWALKLDAPKVIEASGPEPHPELAPASMSARYEYGARGDMPPVELTWYQGSVKPKIYTEGRIPQWDSACLFIGDDGMLLSDYSKHVLLPESKFANFATPAPTIPSSPGHHEEWILACKTGSPTTCNFAYSGALTEANHLGNVAFKSGKRLEWDPVNLKLPNAPEAEKFLGRIYREGWKLE